MSQLEQSNVQFETAATRAYESNNAPEDKANLSSSLQNVTNSFLMINKTLTNFHHY